MGRGKKFEFYFSNCSNFFRSNNFPDPWIFVVEILFPVVWIEENISTEEVTLNELDLEEDTKTELALVGESIKIETDEVYSLVVEDEVVDKADIVLGAVIVVETVTGVLNPLGDNTQ